MIHYLNPEAVGDYSSAGLSSGTSTDLFVFAAGLALDQNTMKRREDARTISNEVRICLDNIDIILTEEGLDRRDIIKVTCYLRENTYRGEFIEAYTRLMAPPYPARCTFVLGLASNLRVQIEAIAAKHGGELRPA